MEKVLTVMVIMEYCHCSAYIVSFRWECNIPVSKVTYSYAPVMGGGCQIPSPLAQGEESHFSFEVGGGPIRPFSPHGPWKCNDTKKVNSEYNHTRDIRKQCHLHRYRHNKKADTPSLFMLKITESQVGRKVINSIVFV